MTYQPRPRAGIIPRGVTEALCITRLRSAHQFLNAHLGVDTQLTIERKVNWGLETYYAGLYIDSEKHIIINMRLFRGHSIWSPLVVLGHEMRHAVQYQEGWLDTKLRARRKRKVNGQKILTDSWKGELFTDIPERQTPWEVDAAAFQDVYAHAALEAGIVSTEEAEMVLPGERICGQFSLLSKRQICMGNPGRNICWFVSYLESKEEWKARKEKLFDVLKLEMAKRAFDWINGRFNQTTWILDKEIDYDNPKTKGPIELIAQFKKVSRRLIDPHGGCWLALDQLSQDFSSWTADAVAYAFSHHQELMQKQYIRWLTSELTVADLVC